MAIVLSDDGTLDTVLKCDECGEKFRFNYQYGDDNEPEISRDDMGYYKVDNMRFPTKLGAEIMLYDRWVTERRIEVENEHKCGEGE